MIIDITTCADPVGAVRIAPEGSHWLIKGEFYTKVDGRLEKGILSRLAPVGTHSVHGGVEKVKQANGKWIPVAHHYHNQMEDHMARLKEHHDRHAEQLEGVSNSRRRLKVIESHKRYSEHEVRRAHDTIEGASKKMNDQDFRNFAHKHGGYPGPGKSRAQMVQNIKTSIGQQHRDHMESLRQRSLQTAV